MFSSRKPLAIALTLVIMLAMLVPAAMAAPEWAHGVNITAPTQANPAYVNPLGAPASSPYVEKQGDKGFKAKFDMTIIGTQVDDILVTIRAIDANNHVAVWKYQYVVATTGLATAQTSDFLVPMAPDGWYDLQICIQDLNNGPWPTPPTSDVFCDEEKNALLIDSAKPGAELIKPVDGAVAQRRLSDGRQGLGSRVGLERSVHAIRWRRGNLVRLLCVHQLPADRWLVRAERRELDQARRRNQDRNAAGRREGSTSSPGTRPRCLTTMVLFGSAPWIMSSSRPAMWRRSSW